MDSCAVSAKTISSSKVPASFNASVAADQHNTAAAEAYRIAHPSTTAGGKPGEIDSKLLKVIPPGDKNYMVSLKGLIAELEACGKKYAAMQPIADALMKQLQADANTSTGNNSKQTADEVLLSKALSNAVVAYRGSRQALSAEIAALSNNRTHQAYASLAIVKQFLGTP